MLKKKLEQQVASNPVKTQQQLNFESQWKADPSTENPSSSTKTHAPLSSEKFTEEGQAEFSLYSSDSRFKPESSDKQNLTLVDSFEVISPFDLASSRRAIPGLDIEPEMDLESEVDIPMDVVELDEDRDYLPEDKTFISDPPPMPSFSKTNRQLMKISELLDEPGRYRRPKK
jgi:hypothetical protein